MKITNIVAVANMKQKFDLNLLNLKLDNSELTSSKNWLKMRLKPKDNYVAFYASGKFLVTGVKSFKELEDVVKSVMKKLNDVNITAELDEVKLSNMVATDEMELDLSLDNLINFLDCSNASYEPEQFPGLFYKDNDGISYTLFSSGKLIVTGFTDLDIAKNNLNKFKKLINSLQ